MRLTFSREVVQESVAIGPRLTDPTAEPGSLVEFVARVTPAGGVIAQGLLVILVYALYILKAPATTAGLLLGVILLVLSAWVPVVLGFGSTLAASATLINVALGAFTYKAFVGRTED